MARAGITYRDVTTAVSALQGAHQNITIENVRHHLGTGSHSTIAHHLKTWREQNKQGGLMDGAHLPKTVLAFAQGLWQRLQEEASSQIKEERAKLTAQQKTSHDALALANQQLIDQKNKAHDLEEALQDSHNEKKALQGQLTKEAQLNHTLTERTHNLERHLDQWEKKYNDLHQLLKNAQQNLDHYQQASQKLREEQALLVDRKEQEYQKKLDHLLQQYTEAIAKTAKYKGELEQALTHNEKIQLENNTLHHNAKDLQNRNQSLSVKAETLLTQHQQAIEQNNSQSAAWEAHKERLVTYKSEAGIIKDQVTRLQKSLAQSEDKIKKLRHDNLFLTQEKANLAGQFQQLQTMINTKVPV